MTAEIRTIILGAAHRHGANNVRIFGSAARETTHRKAIWICWLSSSSVRVYWIVALAQDSGDVLGIKIDVVTEKALHPLIRAEILAQAQPL